MKTRGTDFVMYQVSDLARAARFYRETLGLWQEVYSEQWQWAEFNCGNVALCLHGGVELPEKIAGGRIALAVEDVYAACSELKSNGAHVVGEPVDYSVCCAVEVLDPDGNTVILHKRADGTCGQNPRAEGQGVLTIESTGVGDRLAWCNKSTGPRGLLLPRPKTYAHELP